MTTVRAPYVDTGDTMPDFTADSSNGRINLHDTIRGHWALVSTHPRAFTPVCSTEIVAEARRVVDIHRRGVVTVTISEGTADDQRAWAAELGKHSGVEIPFPIVADVDRAIGRLLGAVRINPGTGKEALSRTTYIIDPKGTVRWRVTYPFAIGRGLNEIVRVLEALQASDRDNVFTPSDWQAGDPVLVLGDVELFDGDGYESVTPDAGTDQKFSELAALPYVKLFKKTEGAGA